MDCRLGVRTQRASWKPVRGIPGEAAEHVHEQRVVLVDVNIEDVLCEAWPVSRRA
jgi:predicted secreted protein